MKLLRIKALHRGHRLLGGCRLLGFAAVTVGMCPALTGLLLVHSRVVATG